MLGAIIGDIAGSKYEFNNHRNKEFTLLADDCYFTDDTVCTIATMDWLLKGAKLTGNDSYAYILQSWCLKYPEPKRSYGGSFQNWFNSPNPQPYNSFGNGAAMRVSPVGTFFNNEKNVLDYAEATAKVSHNHPEGIKGAQAVALAVYLARKGKSMAEIKCKITMAFRYNLNLTCAKLQKSNSFNETCQGTVPQAIVAFLESTGFEDAIRNAISIGGDSDTIAAITGGIAEAKYGIPDKLKSKALTFLPEDMKIVVELFYK